jgi:Glucan phosphorylase
VKIFQKVFYPNEGPDAGKEFPLFSKYFFCWCSVKDIIGRYRRAHVDDGSRSADQVVIQLNDTHPAISIPELMRILLDRAELVGMKRGGLVQKYLHIPTTPCYQRHREVACAHDEKTFLVI